MQDIRSTAGPKPGPDRNPDAIVLRSGGVATGARQDGSVLMSNAVLTDRLLLRPLAHDDLEATFAVYSDPATWTHLPTGRHTDREQTAWMIGRSTQSWAADGLGYWSAALREPLDALPAGAVVGSGGVRRTIGPAWNLGYRFDPRAWGHGLATELAHAAVAAARTADPDLPVITRVLATNPASFRVAERAGLVEVWRSNAADALPRVIHADRALDQTTLAALIALG